jgi:hypothetical protein
MRGTWNPDTAVGDVLVWAGIEARGQEGHGFHKFPGLWAGDAFRQWDVEVASAAGGDIRDVADTATFQKGSESLGIIVNNVP